MPEARPLAAIVLAAGAGTRMRSERPKPLHLLCGRSMVLYVLDALVSCTPERVVVVVGHGGERVTKKVAEEAPAFVVDFVEQGVQRGTGDAVSVALTAFPDDGDDDADDVIVVPGDTPLLRPETLAALVAKHAETGAAATVLTAHLDDPTGYGRIVRGREERVVRVVEQADATPEEQAITEVNTSIYCFRRSLLAPALRRLTPENAQGEYYLTDVVSVLHEAGYPVHALVADADETHGVNDRRQLASAEAELRRRTNDYWMANGVTMVDPAMTYLDRTVRLANDVTLFPGTMLQGRTVVDEGVEIGPNTRLVDCRVGAHAVVTTTTGQQADVGAGAIVGPYASLPPGSLVPEGAVTGAFYTAPGPDDGPVPPPGQ